MPLDPQYFRERIAPDTFGVQQRYAELPEACRMVVTEEQFAWLGDAEKSRLQRDLTEPEPET